LLQRDPESDAAIDAHIESSRTLVELSARMMGSAEYKRKHPAAATLSMSGDEPANVIDLDPDPDEMRLLFDHVEATWSKLGNEDPYWSVSSGDQFRKQNISKTIDAFYARGRTVVDAFLTTLHRCGVDTDAIQSVMDFGCGLGRNTMWLAETFDSVVGYDISASHLRIADDQLRSKGHHNTRLVELQLSGLNHLEPVDAVFSVIVLQHNPPPLIAVLVDRLLDALKPNGVAYLQVPTYQHGYSFDLVDYLSDLEPDRGMEMHVLPQRAMFDIADRHGCRPLEVLEDSWAGQRLRVRSNTFILKKAAAP
jgi:SAM-dependent methyltransferase